MCMRYAHALVQRDIIATERPISLAPPPLPRGWDARCSRVIPPRSQTRRARNLAVYRYYTGGLSIHLRSTSSYAPVHKHRSGAPTGDHPQRAASSSSPSPSLPCQQEAGSLLSRASSIDTSDTESPYNAACAAALSGDASSCFQALTEFCRRLTVTITAPDVSSSKRDAARWSLREASGDVDLEGVRAAEWFAGLLNSTDAALAGRA